MAIGKVDTDSLLALVRNTSLLAPIPEPELQKVLDNLLGQLDTHFDAQRSTVYRPVDGRYALAAEHGWYMESPTRSYKQAPLLIARAIEEHGAVWHERFRCIRPPVI